MAIVYSDLFWTMLMLPNFPFKFDKFELELIMPANNSF